jgi:predicted  nucleic acid-binding Zn-ribbon protein
LLQPIHAAVDIVVDFADQFVRLEAENVQLHKAAKSSADQVQEANKLAAEAQSENTSLKDELKKLKKKMKEEQESKLKAYAEADKKEGALRKSIESLLSKISPCSFTSPFLKIFCRRNEIYSMIF